MADRDASEVRGTLRAQVQVLNALRATQLEQGEMLGALVEGQHRHDEVLSRHGALLDGLTVAVRSLADGQERQGRALDELTGMVRRLSDRAE